MALPQFRKSYLRGYKSPIHELSFHSPWDCALGLNHLELTGTSGWVHLTKSLSLQNVCASPVPLLAVSYHPWSLVASESALNFPRTRTLCSLYMGPLLGVYIWYWLFEDLGDSSRLVATVAAFTTCWFGTISYTVQNDPWYICHYIRRKIRRKILKITQRTTRNDSCAIHRRHFGRRVSICCLTFSSSFSEGDLVGDFDFHILSWLKILPDIFVILFGGRYGRRFWRQYQRRYWIQETFSSWAISFIKCILIFSLLFSPDDLVGDFDRHTRQ